MDLINNLVYTALNSVGGFSALTQRFFPLPPDFQDSSGVTQPINSGNFFSYNLNVLEAFCAIDDPGFIENAIQKHWADMATVPYYHDVEENIVTPFVDKNNPNVRTPLYHLIYPYLVENTRAIQIIEKLLLSFLSGEMEEKPTGSRISNLAIRWMQNTENLFFNYLDEEFNQNNRSILKPTSVASRRNAYYRMFGMDLAFGDRKENAPVEFHKPGASNKNFISFFEKFLTQFWKSYSNSIKNTGGNIESSSIIETAQKLREMLMAIRTTELDFTNYRFANLSNLEYTSSVLASWIYFIISYNSPLVQFFNCTGNTAGERLIKIAQRVRISAHIKSDYFLIMAPAMNNVLRNIELDLYSFSNEPHVKRIIGSHNPSLSPPGTPDEMNTLNEILMIINQWEKATGHRIKNPDSEPIELPHYDHFKIKPKDKL
jgi:hypothetical protein